MRLTEKTEPEGRWRCHLCVWPRWTTGRYSDWMAHWEDEHQEDR